MEDLLLAVCIVIIIYITWVLLFGDNKPILNAFVDLAVFGAKKMKYAIPAIGNRTDIWHDNHDRHEYPDDPDGPVDPDGPDGQLNNSINGRNCYNNGIFSNKDNMLLNGMAHGWASQDAGFEKYCLEKSHTNAYINNMCSNTPPDGCKSRKYLNSWWVNLNNKEKSRFVQ